MTVPLIVLAVFSVVVAWGVPPWEAHKSRLPHELELSQPASLRADFGSIVDERAMMAHGYHNTAGLMALLMVIFGLAFAWVLYSKRLLDPADARDQFRGVYRFLTHKWYFDEVYSALLVRPALTVAGWARVFDTYVIDGFVNWLGRFSVQTARLSGSIDRGIVDGLVNVTGNALYATGAWMRTLQTGYLRSYILFLALAAMAIWFLLASLFGVAIGSQ